MYRRFGGKRECKKYLHGRSDGGARRLFKLGTYGLNEELGRHSDRDGGVECTLCGAECETVSGSVIALLGIIFRKCSTMIDYAEFEILSSVETTSCAW